MKTRFLFLFLLAVLVTSCSAFTDKKDDELAACPEGQTLTAGACVTVNPSVSCAAASDCQGGMICQSGACVQAPAVAGCADNSQCTEGKVCVSGACVANVATGCTDNNQCDAGKVCTDGSCVASAAVPECTTDTNPCTDGRTCVDGVCVVPYAVPECDEDIDCDSGEACTAGECVAVAACGNGTCDAGESHASCPADCAEVAAMPVCGNGTCDVSESRASCPADCSRVITEDMRQGVIPCPAGFERNRGGTCVATGGAGDGSSAGEGSVTRVIESRRPTVDLNGIGQSISQHQQDLIDAGLCYPQKYNNHYYADRGDYRKDVPFVIKIYSEPNYRGDYIRLALFGANEPTIVDSNGELHFATYHAGSMEILKGPNYVNESSSKRDKVKIAYGMYDHFTFNSPRRIPDMSAFVGGDGVTRDISRIWTIEFVRPEGLDRHKCAEIPDQNDELRWHDKIPMVVHVNTGEWPYWGYAFDAIRKTNFDRSSGGRASPDLFDNRITQVEVCPGPDFKSSPTGWVVNLYDGAFNDLLYNVSMNVGYETSETFNFNYGYAYIRRISSIDIVPK